MTRLLFPKPRKKKPRPRRFGSSLPVGEKTPRKARKPVKRVNTKRRASEFERAYGGEDRVQWFKERPCLFARFTGAGRCEGVIENCHTANGGKSRKADAKTIVPGCTLHHRMYDRHQSPFNNAEIREVIKAHAPKFDRAWQLEAARQSHVAVHPERK